MIRKPKFKIGRRLGAGVYDKCQTRQFVASQARHTKASTKRPKALSDYGVQLIEKQKIRYSYGITEKQLSNYVNESLETRGAIPANKLHEKLESRLDNAVYRMGLAHTRALARQMVSHGHFIVNGHKSTVPSCRLKVGDIIKVREGSKKSVLCTDVAKRLENYPGSEWLKLDMEKLEASVTGLPKNQESFIDLNTVLEFYSR